VWIALLLAMLVPPAIDGQDPDKQLVVTISGQDLGGGIVSELTWGSALMIQGVFAKPGGELDAQYFVVPATGLDLQQRDQQTDASLKYLPLVPGPLGLRAS
jgi:hypothetical protein